MSTLTGNKISLTYKSLIKTADNDVLSGALKQLSDGLGNNSGVYLNTGGDLKSTGTLEFANFKGTSTAVTINKLVNEADGISNNDNDTSLPTSAAVKDYVDTHVTTQDLDFSDGTNPGAVDLDSQVFAIVGTSNEIETSASGQQLQIGLPDNVTISGTFFATEFQGALAGTINSGTTAVTQTAGDNSTKVATTAYVDTLDAASDLDFSGDSGTGDVNLNTESLALTGTANQITTAASNQGLEISLLSTGVTMPDGSVATTQTAGDNSTKLATTAYVDTLDAASDLDITDGTNTSDINLNTESLSILGTANEIVSTVSAQTATISLPSTINVNVNGNVTGDLTGNADTATAWQTARDLSLTSEATGTISSVDGSGNVSGAVTLLNSAVTAKVLTGLPTPAAGNIEPSDTILEAFGKVQSQINSISSGLVFKGSWDAATNTPNLTSGGGEVDSGTTDGATTAFKLIDSSQNFNTTVSVGNKVINQVDGQTALVTVIDSNTQLTLDADIMLTAEAYTIDASPFISQGQYYVVNFAGTTNLNGINNWSIGDWVIADANNEWSKLDHSQIDGQGTTGNLPVFTTANTIGDSIVSESGTALTVTGSLTTTLGASVTGDLAINTNKFTVNATSGNISVGGTGTFAGSVTGTSISDGFITMGFAQINRNGAAIELQYAGSANSLVQIGGGGSNPITFNANTGNASFAGNVSLPDSKKAIFGAGSDLTIEHDGSNSYINDTGTGALVLRSSQTQIQAPTGELAGVFNQNSSVQLYYDNVEKFETTSTGVSVTGNIGTSGSVLFDDNQGINFGNSNAKINGSSSDGIKFFGTGSEKMRLTQGGNLGIGTDSPQRLLHLRSTNEATGIFLERSANYGFVQYNQVVGSVETYHLGFVNNNTFSSDILVANESGNVGIGTDSPRSTLDVTGTTGLTWNSAALESNGLVTIGTRGTGGSLFINTQSINTDWSAGLGIDGSYSSNVSTVNIKAFGPKLASGGLQGSNLTFSTTYETTLSERMRIDRFGNVGIGTDNPQVPLQIGTHLATAPADTGLCVSNRKSIRINDADGSYNFGVYIKQNYSGSSYLILGTTHNAVETDALFVKSGNVGIGTDSPDATLSLENSQSTAANNTTTGSIFQALSPNSGIFMRNRGSSAGIGGASYSQQLFTDTASGNFEIYNIAPTFDLILGTNATERMRIDSSGKVGIGVNASDYWVNANNLVVGGLGAVSGITIATDGNLVGSLIFADGTLGGDNTKGGLQYDHSTNDMLFRVNNAERMRITSGGDVLFDVTAISEITGASQNGQAWYPTFASHISSRTITGVANHFIFYNPNGNVGQIQTSGYSTLFNTSSDYRLKEDLQDFAGLDMVSKIPVYDFKWKTDESRNYGVMAHELQEVLPQAVSGDKDAEEMQSVDYSKIVPLLVKSIQELKAEVDKLKQECKCK